MAKKDKSRRSESDVAESSALVSILSGDKDQRGFDPAVTSLFAQSAGPVKPPQFQRGDITSQPRSAKVNGTHLEKENDDEVMDTCSDGGVGLAEDNEDSEVLPAADELSGKRGRKRKRGDADDQLEESYMQWIEKLDARHEERKQKLKDEQHAKPLNIDNTNSQPPLHESLTKQGNEPTDTHTIDKPTRTVFLGNVSTEAIRSKPAKKALITHLSSFLPSLPAGATPHKIESIRFRSTAFAAAGMPRRAAFAKRELMDSTTQSTNAYVVYSTQEAAIQAPRALNGSVILDRHLRVDSVAHPSPIDHKRCVFVGNLAFVAEETDPGDNSDNNNDDAANPDKKRMKKMKKSTTPADVEEGLWRTFSTEVGGTILSKKQGSVNRGPVESVRVVRDSRTRVGKGFAYVQFHDQNSVEAALLLDGKKFPPLLPRKLRVVRAKRITASSAKNSSSDRRVSYRQGRIGSTRSANPNTKPLGKRGAVREGTDRRNESRTQPSGLVFEGHRASAARPKPFSIKSKSCGVKSKPSKGSAGAKKNKSTRRAAAYRTKMASKN